MATPIIINNTDHTFSQNAQNILRNAITNLGLDAAKVENDENDFCGQKTITDPNGNYLFSIELSNNRLFDAGYNG